MGVTFTVTPPEVKAMASRLRGLREEFESIDDDTEGYASVDVSGDERVGSKLEDFGNNWDDKRHEMANKMGELAELADGAADAYAQTEQAISDGFEGAGSGSGETGEA
ncbi:MAG: WXG100 family type VII secretion target [Acidimicrobiales bacterium]